MQTKNKNTTYFEEKAKRLQQAREILGKSAVGLSDQEFMI
jgi:hypothetical protein